MQFTGRHALDDGNSFPMAAMIDIIFLLLIFFVSTSVFYRLEAEMDIVIPTASEAEVSERSTGEIIVNVRKDGSLVVNQREMTPPELTQILKRVSELYKGQAVIVRGDGEARHQDIMNVLNACAQADIWNISFAALKETPSETPRLGG